MRVSFSLSTFPPASHTSRLRTPRGRSSATTPETSREARGATRKATRLDALVACPCARVACGFGVGASVARPGDRNNPRPSMKKLAGGCGGGSHQVSQLVVRPTVPYPGRMGRYVNPDLDDWGPGKEGRQYPRNTALGRVAAHRGIKAKDLSARSGVHPRTLTEYLAGRKPIREQHVLPLAEVLQCPPEVLLRPIRKGLRPRNRS